MKSRISSLAQMLQRRKSLTYPYSITLFCETSLEYPSSPLQPEDKCGILELHVRPSKQLAPAPRSSHSCLADPQSLMCAMCPWPGIKCRKSRHTSIRSCSPVWLCATSLLTKSLEDTTANAGKHSRYGNGRYCIWPCRLFERLSGGCSSKGAA